MHPLILALLTCVTYLGGVPASTRQKSILPTICWTKRAGKTALEGPPGRHTPLVGDTFNLPVKNRGHPLFAPFLTLFDKNGVNKGPSRGSRQVTRCLTCAPRATPTPSRGMNMVSWGSGEQNNASGGRGSGYGAQVRHMATYRDPYEGTLLFAVFTKKCQKRCKTWYPLFLTGFELAPPT